MIEFIFLWFLFGWLLSYQYVKIDCIENKRQLDKYDKKAIFVMSCGGFITLHLLR